MDGRSSTAVEQAFWIALWLREQFERIVAIAADQRAAMTEGAAPGLQRMGDIRDFCIIALGEVRLEPRG